MFSLDADNVNSALAGVDSGSADCVTNSFIYLSWMNSKIDNLNRDLLYFKFEQNLNL